MFESEGKDRSGSEGDEGEEGEEDGESKHGGLDAVAAWRRMGVVGVERRKGMSFEFSFCTFFEG